MDEQPTTTVVVGSKNIVGQNLTNVGNHTYSIRVGADQDPLRVLLERVAPEAMHDSGEVNDQGVCHPGTRTFVLETILRRITSRSPDCPLIWMKGAAGAGKSSIARTVTQNVAQECLFLASFFCWRSSDRRSDASLVIPTLIHQIITYLPSLRPFVEEVLQSDPYIFSKSMEIQARRLLVGPLTVIKADRHATPPCVIVIDGLDELKDKKGQCDILKTVAFLVENLPFPTHFFIASRPEYQIEDYFTYSMGERWSLLSLDETYHPDEDILIYYKDHFSEIVAAFPAFRLAVDWPGEEIRALLVAKGSGQFIFAATVIRFVGNTSISISPQKRLDMILANVSNDNLKPLELLDLVYVTVFKAVPEGELRDVLRLVGLVLLPIELKKSPRVLDAVLSLEPGTTENRLRYLHSVLKAPSFPDGVIRPLHATLGDFVFSHHRSGSFGLHLEEIPLRQDVVLNILKASMVHPSPAYDQLADCFYDWFTSFRYTIANFLVSDSKFRKTLRRCVDEAEGRDLASWTPLALVATYRLVCDTFWESFPSSLFRLKDEFLWSRRRKKIAKEVDRRASLSYKGVTGQLIISIFLIAGKTLVRNDWSGVWNALPAQGVLADHHHSSLALHIFVDDINSYKFIYRTIISTPFYDRLQRQFLDPAFLEALFQLVPWHSSSLESSDVEWVLTKCLELLESTETASFRLLSLRNLPANNPSWGIKAKDAFSKLMEMAVDKRASIIAEKKKGLDLETAKRDFLKRAAAWEKKNAGR